MLEKYLTRDTISLNFTAKDWEAAVRKGGELLVNAGKCLPGYVDAMVRTVRELGPYMVIAPGLALAHARPEDGALAIGLSLVTLDTPVAFGSAINDPVELVISFCAVNKNDHIGMLKDLADFLRSDDNMSLLKTAKTIDEVLQAVANRKRK